MKIRKIITCLLPLPMITSSLSIATLTSCGDEDFKSKDVKFYLLSATNSKTQKLYFSDEHKGIPYIDLNDAATFFENYYSVTDVGAKISVKVDDTKVTLTRENGATLTFDFSANKVYSEDINLFRASSGCKIGLDILGTDDNFYDEQGKKIEGQVRFAQRSSKPKYTKPQQMSVRLSTYSINIYQQNKKYLVPFTTFYNIAGFSTIACLFNGQDLFVTGQQITDPDYFNLFYSFQQQTRPQALREYNYHEFCRDLDFVYGLKTEHNISSFDTFMKDNGLKDLLLSESRYDEDKAYSLLQYNYIEDNHTGFTIQNAYGGYDATEAAKITSEIPIDPAYIQNMKNTLKTSANRMQYKVIDASSKVITPVLQTSDSLILTFDKFVNKDIDFYYSDDFKTLDQKKAIAETGDTIAMISYANHLVKQDVESGSPTIKNVVIDLTANTGGMATSALFVLG